MTKRELLIELTNFAGGDDAEVYLLIEGGAHNGEIFGVVQGVAAGPLGTVAEGQPTITVTGS